MKLSSVIDLQGYTFVLQFVIPTANYAAKLLLRMGKECPKHVEFLD
jgi:hypothetical protein